jgi:zinc protease
MLNIAGNIMRRTRMRSIPGLALLAILCGGPAVAGMDLRNASVEELGNGMTVILLEDRNFPVVSVQMLYRAGARNESYGQTGIAHFLEHMAFRDTADFPGTGVVSSIYARGGEWHGYTWTDQTTYFATVPKDHVDLLLRIEADRMARLVIAKDDMEAERGAVLAEMHSYENYPESMLLDAVMYASFIAHPYRNNTIGWESDIENLSHADVVAFYERHYKPSNAVLAVVGDFKTDAALARIGQLFGELEPGTPTPLPHTVEPLQDGERRVRLHGNVDRKRFMIAWRAPSSGDPDFPAFLVLQDVLGGGSGVNFAQNDWGTAVGEDSVLYGAAEDMTTWYPPSAQDYAFVVGGTIDADVAEAKLEEVIAKRLAAVREGAIGEEAVAAAIEAVHDQLVYDVQTTEDAAHQLAFFAGLGALDVLFELPSRLSAVTADDVQRTARKWLLPHRRTIGWYVPDARTEPEQIAGPVSAGAPRVESPPPAPLDHVPVPGPVVRTLTGGIAAIVQRSDLSPAACVQLVLRGDAAGDGIEHHDPVLAHSSLSWRIRPDELQATLVEGRQALAAAVSAPRRDQTPSADPETRLEQAFADVMAQSGQGDESPAPALIVVTGDVAEDETFALLEEHFGDLEGLPEHASPSVAFDPAQPEISIGHSVAQAQLGYIVPAPGPNDPRSWAWRILLYVLSHGYEGRLGEEAISNRGLAYYVDSRYRSDGANGWVTMAVGVDPHKQDELKELMLAEMRRLRDEPPSPQEIAEAKAHLVGRAESAAQSNAELADALAQEWLWFGDVQAPAELEAVLERIGREDVIDAVAGFLAGRVVTVSE